MTPKRAAFLSYGNDDLCAETRRFIEEAGVLLSVRDISKNPLSEAELSGLIGNLPIKHFLNAMSDSYTKYHLDKHLPDRDQLIKLLAQDHTLLRRPIVKSSRLVTVGCDKRKISEMLQISPDGQSHVEQGTDRTTSRNDRHRSAATKKSPTLFSNQ